MWWRVLASAFLLTACTFTGGSANGADGGAEPDGPSASDAGADAPATSIRRKPITIASQTTGDSLADFPLLVALDDDDELRAHASESGADIFFVAADGASPLDYEIERWDPVTGTLLAWVRVPLIDRDADTTVYLRYGDVELAAEPDPVGVWRADFAAVFHLNNSPDDAIVDSTGERDGSAHPSMDDGDLVVGKLGLGLELDGGNDVIDFANPFVADRRSSAHTISAWVSQEASNNGEALVVLGAGGSSNRSRFLHSRFTGGMITAGLYGDDLVTDDDIQDAGFKLVHWTYTTGAETSIYVDGVLVEGPHTHDNPADTQGMQGRIGNAPGGGGGFGSNMGLNGVVDEVRIATAARSAAWIAAEFANQTDPDGFYTVGAEQR